MAKHKEPFINREISWLAFNGRVLQEAADPSVPLLERLKFLAIYSSNLDEFFRVRVASLRSLLRLKKKTQDKLDFIPKRLLSQIHHIVGRQQEQFGRIFREQILPALAAEGLALIDERTVTAGQGEVLQTYFHQHVGPLLEPTYLQEAADLPFLKNRGLYLAVELWPLADQRPELLSEPKVALVPIPSPPLPRFIVVSEATGSQRVLFLDDVIRYNLSTLFPDFEVGTAYAIKLTRDAELYLEDEFSGNLVEMIRKSLNRRETGLPTRFLYDLRTPYALLALLKRRFQLDDDDMVAGGRYHNFNDFFSFPNFGRDDLLHPPLPPLPHPVLADVPSVLAAMAERDHLVHVPYQRFDPVLRFLNEAAFDPDVEAMWITLYRVASDSSVAKALIAAAQEGKAVTAFVEVKARFDEATNLQWADRMEAAGVEVLYSMPGLKVHAKTALVARREGDQQRYYAYLGTGNFNEKTARLYADHGLLTADRRLTDEVRRVFHFLEEKGDPPHCEHLMVAPFQLRKGFYRLIDQEIEAAEAGLEAWMVLKMNSLEDPKMIARLYKASQAGVRIRLIVRGICSLVPGIPNVSDRIEVISIVDRYLEHARIYLFSHRGEPRLYLASADWMRRNLSRRVEVAFPVYDEALQRELRHFLDLQWDDNTKARSLDAQQQNTYRRQGTEPVQAQLDTYRLLAANVQDSPAVV